MLPGQDFGPALDAKMPRANLEFIDPDFLRTLEIPLLYGKAFSEEQYLHGDSVALLNKSFARQLFGDKNPLGRIVRLPALTSGYGDIQRPPSARQGVQIIGITGDVFDGSSLSEQPRQTIYLPQSLFLGSVGLQVHLRTTGDPIALLEDVRKEMNEVDSSQPIAQARTIRDVLENDFWNRDRWLAIIFTGFSTFALLLAGSGLYSVVSHSVIRQTREIGIRFSLGAAKGDVLVAILSSELPAVAFGLIFGSIAIILVRKTVQSVVQTRTSDMDFVFLSIGLLILVSISSVFIPAWRASKIDPMQAIRSE